MENGEDSDLIDGSVIEMYGREEMSMHIRKTKRKMRGIAAVLALALMLSNLPAMQLMAAPERETVDLSAEETGESGTGGTETAEAEDEVESSSEEPESGTEELPGETEEETKAPGSEASTESGEEELSSETEDEAESETETETETESTQTEEDTEEAGVMGFESTEGGLSEEEIDAQRALRPKYMPEMEVIELPEHYERPVESGIYSILEPRYDSREEGILSAIRNQNPWGTCWSFAALGSMETSLRKQGMETSPDLSERHLAYFTYHTGNDRLGNAGGDTISSSDYLDLGGNSFQAAMRLMNWQGAAAENSYPYQNSKPAPADLEREAAQDDVYHMRACYFLDTKANTPETIENVKVLVKEYGAVAWSYYDADQYYNYNTKAYYNCGIASTNHAIMVVGWDDDFPKERFKGQQPKEDGAWIVRNSWGTGWGENGYFYISYEDVSLGCGNAAAVFVADTADNYDNNYFNSNTHNSGYSYVRSAKFAQVYQVKGLTASRERLRAVSFMTNNTNTEYQIQIYKNPKLVNGVVQDPESGEEMLESPLSVDISYAGVYTVDLPPIEFKADDYMAAVIYIQNGGGNIWLDQSGNSGSTSWKNEIVPGESFYAASQSGSWNDMYNRGQSARINLLTDDVEEEAGTELIAGASVTQIRNFSDAYKVNLRWNKLSGASGYEIYRADALNGGYVNVGKTADSVRQFKDEIPQENYSGSYFYKIRAQLENGAFVESEPVEVVLEERIEFAGFRFSFDGNVAALSWSAIAGASGYEIQRKKEGEAYTTLVRLDSSHTAYEDDLSDAETGNYQYRVRAYKGTRYTEWSQEETAVMGFKLEPINYNTIRVFFPVMKGATSYLVWLRLGNSLYGRYVSPTNGSVSVNMEQWIKDLQGRYPDRGIADFGVGNDYFCYIEILNGPDINENSIYESPMVTFHTVPDALEFVSLELTDADTAKLTWSGGSGADSVVIYRSEEKDSDGDTYRTVSAEEKSFEDADVIKGKTYYYRICPTVINSGNETVKGPVSEEKEIVIPALSISNLTAEYQEKAVIISWDRVSRAKSYRVYGKAVGEEFQALGTTEANSFRWNDAKAGTFYTFKVTILDQSGRENDQEAVCSLVIPVSIGTVSAVGEGMLRVRWSGAAGISYDIYRGEEPENLILRAGSLETDTFEDDQIITGKTYYYKVLARVNGQAASLEDTEAKTGQTKPDRPVLVESSYDTITIQSNPDFAYAIGTVYGNMAGRRFVDGAEEQLTFEGLAQNSGYYIAVRTKKDVTGEDPVYGTELFVRTDVKAELVLAPVSVVFSKGNRTEFTATVIPENIHYEELSWTAETPEGAVCKTDVQGKTVIVRGKDEKEILRIMGNTLYAVGESGDKEVCLRAAKGTMAAEMKVRVNVPVTGLTIRAQSGQDIDLTGLQVGDRISIEADCLPGNADDAEGISWSVSNSRVASVEEAAEGTGVVLTAKGTGECILRACTADGVSAEQKISVKKADAIYGIWLLGDALPDEIRMKKNADGSFSLDGLEEKPVYEMRADQEDDGFSLDAYFLIKDPSQMQDGETIGIDALRQANGEVIYRSTDSLAAAVDGDGRVTAIGAGEAEIFAFDTKGNGIYGSCQVKVSGNRVSEEVGCPIASDRKLSAVKASFQIQKFEYESLSSCVLQVKDQSGRIFASDQFTFVSDDPTVCMVSEDGIVTPNPTYAGTKNKSVKITASVKNDPKKRKVVFTVTVLAANQIDWIVLKRIDEGADSAQDIIGEKFEKGMTSMTFAAEAVDCRKQPVEDPSLNFKVSDGSVAAVKVNKDKTITVTFKKAGRTELICTAKDALKRTASVQLAAISSAPVISTKQVSLNKMLEENGEKQCVSESFLITLPDGAQMDTPEITAVRTGNKLSPDGDKFHVVENGDSSFSIAIDNKGGDADNIKNNAVYTLEMAAEVRGIPEIENGGQVKEAFSIKVKVISKEPALSITMPVINRNLVREEDLSGLMIIKSAEAVTDARVCEEYKEIFGTDRKNGQWYLTYSEPAGNKKASQKIKMDFTVKGYKPVTKTLTVKTPLTRQTIRQQSVPVIHMEASDKAEIVLYNSTQKKVLDDFRLWGEQISDALYAEVENNGTLQVVVREGASFKNGATLTANIKVMETKNGEDCWTEPVSLKISVKVFTTAKPTVSMKASTLTLNKSVFSETGTTPFTINCQNVKITDVSKWQIYEYNKDTQKYDLRDDDTAWLKVMYDADEKVLGAAYAAEKYAGESPDAVAPGSYKFRMMGFAEGFEELYKDFTVKVIDTKPTAVIKMSGKLDLVNRANATLAGKVTVKNSASPVKEIQIKEDSESENPHAFYRAEVLPGNAFKLTLTESGKSAGLTTQKQTLPVKITLENGCEISGSITFKPVQTTPKVTVPATQTICKAAGNLTRDYDMTKNLTAGTAIKRIEAVSVPEGLGAIAREGHVLVTLGNRGIKSGSYKIKINIYFEGAETSDAYPYGKPLSKTITVKVTD